MGRLHRWRWESRLERWLDGELPAARVEAVLLHLAECPDCGEEVELQARIRAAVARVESR